MSAQGSSTVVSVKNPDGYRPGSRNKKSKRTGKSIKKTILQEIPRQNLRKEL